jgi:hypothetical protein
MESIPRVVTRTGQPVRRRLGQHEVRLPLESGGEFHIGSLVGDDDAAQAPHLLVQ